MELVYYIAACSHRDLYLIPLPANDLTSGTGLQKREGNPEKILRRKSVAKKEMITPFAIY